MNKVELNQNFIKKINKIRKEKGFKVNNFRKRYKIYEDDLELSKQTKKEIAQSRVEYKAGNTHSFEKIKKMLKL